MVKDEALEQDPPSVTTLIVPAELAPAIAVKEVELLMVKDVTDTPPIEMAEVAPKLVPVMATLAIDSQPLEGVNEDIVGAAQPLPVT